MDGNGRQAMQKHKTAFEEIEINLIHSGLHKQSAGGKADKILYERKRNKRKKFKSILDQDVRQFKTAMLNSPLLTSVEAFTIAGIAKIKQDKRCRILKQMSYPLIHPIKSHL